MGLQREAGSDDMPEKDPVPLVLLPSSLGHFGASGLPELEVNL